MKRFAAVVVLILFSVTLHAYYSPYIDTPKDSVEYRLLTAPDGFLIYQASLVASGVSGSTYDRYAAMVTNFNRQFQAGASYNTTESVAKQVFDFMHRAILKKYRENATTLDTALATGDYNCLSSTLLYASLLELNGVNSRMVVLPSHVYSVIDLLSKEIDVENTTPNGFDVANNPSAQEMLKRITGFNYQPSHSAPETVGIRGIAAYTYANRAFFAAQAGNYTLAFQCALKSYALFPEGKNIYTNVSAAYQSYAYYLLNTKKDYLGAMQVLEDAFANMPTKAEYVQNYKAGLDGYMRQLVDKGDYDGAKAAFEHGKTVTGLPLKDIEENLYVSILYRLVNVEKDFGKAYDYSVKAIAALPASDNVKNMIANAMGLLTKSYIDNWQGYAQNEQTLLKWYALMRSSNFDVALENFYSAVAVKIYDSGDTANGLAFIDKGLARFPNSSLLKQNGVYIAGNAAIKLINAADYPNAVSYLKLALKYQPGAPAILQNLSLSYQKMISPIVNRDNVTRDDWQKALNLVNEGLSLLPNDSNLLYYKDYITRKLQ